MWEAGVREERGVKKGEKGSWVRTEEGLCGRRGVGG